MKDIKELEKQFFFSTSGLKGFWNRSQMDQKAPEQFIWNYLKIVNRVKVCTRWDGFEIFEFEVKDIWDGLSLHLQEGYFRVVQIKKWRIFRSKKNSVLYDVIFKNSNHPNLRHALLTWIWRLAPVGWRRNYYSGHLFAALIESKSNITDELSTLVFARWQKTGSQ